MTQETAYTTDLLRRFADVAPSLNAKAILLVCETTAAVEAHDEHEADAEARADAGAW